MGVSMTRSEALDSGAQVTYSSISPRMLRNVLASKRIHASQLQTSKILARAGERVFTWEIDNKPGRAEVQW